MEWISITASFLHVSNIDVFVIIYAFVLIWGFSAIGISKIYDCFFWLVSGISIFIVTQVLFFQYSGDMTTSTVMNPAIAKFIVGSSIYLIFILSILTPINGIINIGWWSKNQWVRIFQSLILAIFLTGFYTTIIIGLAEKAYIFRLESAFSLLKNISFWQQLMNSSIIYAFLLKNITWIIIAGIGFIVYKLMLWDFIETFMVSMIKNLFKEKDGGEKKV